MNFIVPKNLLESAVVNASHAIVKNPTIPVHGLITFHTYENGVMVSAHGPDISVQTFVDTNATPGLAFGVDGAMFSDIVKRLRGDSIALEINPNAAALNMVGANASVALKIVNEDGFMAPHNYQNMPFIPTTGILDCVKAVSYAASDDETRIYLTCVLINEAEVVAVDGHRMSIKAHGNNLAGLVDSNKGDTLLPADALEKLTKIFKEKDLSMFADDSFVHFNNGKVAASVRKVSREFPKYKNVIPVGGYDELQVKQKDLVDAVEFVRVVTDKDRAINVDITEGAVRVWSHNDKASCIEQTIEAIFNNKVDMSFNSDYLLDVAKRLKNDTISIEVRGPLKPIVIKEGDSLHVVMPRKRL